MLLELPLLGPVSSPLPSSAQRDGSGFLVIFTGNRLERHATGGEIQQGEGFPYAASAGWCPAAWAILG